MKIVKFNFDIFPHSFYVGWNSTLENVKELFEDDFELYRIFEDTGKYPSTLATTYKVNTKDGEGASFIHFHGSKKPKPETIAHEAFHVLCNIASVINSTLDESAEEYSAYILGWIVKCINSTINQPKKN